MSVQPDIRSQLRSLSISREQRPIPGSKQRGGRAVRWLIGVGLVSGLGLGLYGGRRQLAELAGGVEAAEPVRLVTVSNEDSPAASPVLTATGKIVSDHTVNVSTKVSGQITELYFEQGEFVEKGEILARLEDVIYRARRDEAAARLEKARANLEFQKINHERVKKLHAGASAPPIELAEARRLLDEAKAQVAADQAALDFAQKALNDTVVTAPIAGVILSREVEVGDFVAAEGGIGANANARFATIADMSKLRVEVDVSELDIARLRAEMPCRVTPDAYKDRDYDGYVMWIDPGANYSKATVQVKVRIEDPDAYLRVEGTAQVRFFEESPDSRAETDGRGSVWIPASACNGSASGGAATVFVAREGRLHETPVEVGRRRGDLVEITAGLRAGQQIAIASAADGLRDGQSVGP